MDERSFIVPLPGECEKEYGKAVEEALDLEVEVLWDQMDRSLRT